MTFDHHQHDSSQRVDLRRYRQAPPVSPISASWRRATDMTTSLTGWILRRPEQPQPSRTFRVVSVLIVVCALLVLTGLIAATVFSDRLTDLFTG